MYNILHVVSSMNAGGVEKVVYSYCNHIDKEHFHIDIAYYTSPNGVLNACFKSEGCSVYKLPPKHRIVSTIFELLKIIKKNKYDAIHVHLDDQSAPALLAARIGRVKVRIIHSHVGIYHDNKPELIHRLLKQISLSVATDYLACSNKVAREFYHDHNKVTVIKNGIDYSLFEYNEHFRASIRHELKIDNNIVIGNVARLSKEKNPLFVIDILKELLKINTNYRLLLVGGGYYYSEILSYIRQNALEGYVLLIGAQRDAYVYYNVFDAFVLPSLFEGFGISFIEAQVNGLVCFASQEVSKETQISDKIFYYSLTTSPRIWAKKIHEKCRLPRSKDSIKNDSYRIEKVVADLEEYYYSLFMSQV